MANLTEESTSRYVTIADGMKLHYNEAGQGEPLIMLHGGGPGASGWSNFYKNIDFFVDAGYRVFLLDLPGFNKSDAVIATESRDILNSKAVKGFIDALGLDRVHLVGNSMGGATSLAFAIDYPERLAKLILIGPAGTGVSYLTPTPAEGIKLFFRLYREPSRENLERMLDAFVYDPASITPELFERRLNAIMSNPDHLKNFITSVEKSGHGSRDLTPLLPKIQADTLITWGRDDRFLSIDLGLKLVTLIPKAQLHIFNKCGHWGQWEKAPIFNRLVLNFLTQ